MGKVYCDCTGKVWENRNFPKLRVSYIFHVKQKSIKFPNVGKMNSHGKGKVWWSIAANQKYGGPSLPIKISKIK